MQRERLPNIVILFADDLGYGDVGCFGATDWKTPHLDRMARDGIRFTSFYVAQAVCSASRAALLTGCYPNRIGIAGALGPNSKNGLGTDEMTIAEVLKQKGYATGMAGKWHLGHLPPHLPTQHGFDEFFGLPYSNDMWPLHPEAKAGTYPPLPLYENEKILNPDVRPDDQARLTAQYTERAVRFIERNRENPFFFYLPYSMPHVPLYAGERFRGRSKGGLYGDVIEEIDDSVGTIIATLRRLGLERDTLVIFTSDNGPWLSYGNHAGRSGELREGKGTAWEGGVREPFVAQWPGAIPAGTVCHEPAMTIDLLPTIAALAGAAPPKLPIDGKDILPLLKGKTGAKSPHEAYWFYYNATQLHAIRSGKWKLILPHTYRTMLGQPSGKDGIPGKYRMAKTELALYDLDADAGETNDVAERHPDVVKRLLAYAEQARIELGDSLTERTGRGVRASG